MVTASLLNSTTSDLSQKVIDKSFPTAPTGMTSQRGTAGTTGNLAVDGEFPKVWLTDLFKNLGY